MKNMNGEVTKSLSDFIELINIENKRFLTMCNAIGHEPCTTFWMDFSIAEPFGENAIVDTYERAVEQFGRDVEYMAELTLVLNWKIWDIYEIDDELANIYNDLWQRHDSYCWDLFKGEEARRYFEITD